MIVRSLSLVAFLALVACGPSDPPSKTAETPAPTPPAAETPAAPETPAATPTTAALPPPTDAEIEARYTPHLKHCLDTGDAARGVTPAMAGCFSEELRLQDGALNAEYQRVTRAMPEPRKLALRDVQRRWIKDRDQGCDEAANSGGTIDMIDRPACVLKETVRRTIELERMGG